MGTTVNLTVEKRKPGRPSLSENQKQEIRENIIEIAHGLFISEGYENTSMRKIAAQAGFAPTKIYYYFENKKEILRHFWLDISLDLWKYCKPSQELLEGKPLEIVRHLMFKNIRYWLDNPKSYQLGVATQDYRADKSENFDFYTAPGLREYVELMHINVQKCIDEGIFNIKDKLMASQIIGIAVYGVYGSFYSLPMVAWQDKDTLIEKSINNTLLGLQAK
jgi:AcrR family transcriptional regulator